MLLHARGQGLIDPMQVACSFACRAKALNNITQLACNKVQCLGQSIHSPYIQGVFVFMHVQGQGLGGSNATCVQLSSVPGGLTFAMRSGNEPGYQPFKGASSLDFWIKNLNSSTTPPALRVRAASKPSRNAVLAIESAFSTQTPVCAHRRMLSEYLFQEGA